MEGFFTKVFRSGLQPVEVGRRILREMEENRTISVNRTYAANDFQVFMGPDDYERFKQMEAGLEREFCDLVIDKAKQQRWNLMGLPRISFQKVDELGRGEFRVEASLHADPDRQAPSVSTRPPRPDDVNATRAIPTSDAAKMGLESSTSAQLEVLDDEGKPKDNITITRTPVSVGRLSTNDVVLSDSNVSRRHAELRNENGRWTVVDLGSTNGTLVNGKLAKEHQLSDGDRITFGTSELTFKTAKGGKEVGRDA